MTSAAPFSIDAEPVLRVEGLSKSFGAVTVLHDLSFTLHSGTVLGLVGGNGAGKSTLVKILSGFHAPDPGGRVELGGQALPLPLLPGQARHHGLSFVQQELALIPHASVVENLRLGTLRAGRFGTVAWTWERKTAKRALDLLGIDLDLDISIDRLSVTQRALVAVARAIAETSDYDGQSLLVLDEPTAYLPNDGVATLFAAVRRAVAAGTAVLFVSHRLDEVLALTDRIAVLRDGRLVAELITAETTEDEIVDAILGADLGRLYPDREPPKATTVASVRDLSGGTVKNIDFDVRAGEILGLTGIAGMGHDEVPYLLFGGSGAQGSMSLDGKSLDLAKLTPPHAVRHGLALLPADRPNLSGVPEFTVRENVSLPVLRSLFRGVLRRREESALVAGLLERFGVRPQRALLLRLGQLSGGNQQKALLAKWIQTRPALLLLHEPTQGVDVSSRRDVFAKLAELSDAGVAIVVSSAEHEDLAHICNRVLVFRHGRISAELSGSALCERALVEASLRSREPSLHIEKGRPDG